MMTMMMMMMMMMNAEKHRHFITVHLNIKNALLRCCSGIEELFVTLNVLLALEFTIWT
jgi:hypothetical protein